MIRERPEKCELCEHEEYDHKEPYIYKHHIQYYPEVCLWVCNSCHQKIHGNSHDELEPPIERPNDYGWGSPTGVCPNCFVDNWEEKTKLQIYKPNPVCRVDGCDNEISVYDNIREEVKEWFKKYD